MEQSGRVVLWGRNRCGRGVGEGGTLLEKKEVEVSPDFRDDVDASSVSSVIILFHVDETH